jgi:hypothetical protein
MPRQAGSCRSCRTLGPFMRKVLLASSKRRAEPMRCCLAYGLRGPSVLWRPACRFWFSPEVLFHRSSGLSVLRQPALGQHPFRQVRLHRRARHAAFLFSSFRYAGKSPSGASARSVKFTSRLCRGSHRRCPSLPWESSSSAASCLPPLITCPSPAQLAARVVHPSRHTSSHRVRSSRLWSCALKVPAFTAGLTRRCSGPPSAAAELQRWAS